MREQQNEAVFKTVQKRIEERMASSQHPVLIGIGGPGGTGKSTLTAWLLQRMADKIVDLPLDDYRLPRNLRAQRGIFGSHADGNDQKSLLTDLSRLRQRKMIRRPVFDLTSGEVSRTEPLQPGPCILCDGEIAAHQWLRSEWDLLIVVQGHWRTQLNTRLSRDIRQRGCSLEKAMEIFLQSNLRDYPTFAAGADEAADILLYRNTKNGFSTRSISAQKRVSGMRTPF